MIRLSMKFTRKLLEDDIDIYNEKNKPECIYAN